MTTTTATASLIRRAAGDDDDGSRSASSRPAYGDAPVRLVCAWGSKTLTDLGPWLTRTSPRTRHEVRPAHRGAAWRRCKHDHRREQAHGRRHAGRHARRRASVGKGCATSSAASGATWPTSRRTWMARPLDVVAGGQRRPMTTTACAVGHVLGDRAARGRPPGAVTGPRPRRSGSCRATRTSRSSSAASTRRRSSRARDLRPATAWVPAWSTRA